MILNNGLKENLLSVLRVGCVQSHDRTFITHDTRLVKLHSCIGRVHGQHVSKGHLHDGRLQRG